MPTTVARDHTQIYRHYHHYHEAPFQPLSLLARCAGNFEHFHFILVLVCLSKDSDHFPSGITVLLLSRLPVSFPFALTMTFLSQRFGFSCVCPVSESPGMLLFSSLVCFLGLVFLSCSLAFYHLSAEVLFS